MPASVGGHQRHRGQIPLPLSAIEVKEGGEGGVQDGKGGDVHIDTQAQGPVLGLPDEKAPVCSALPGAGKGQGGAPVRDGDNEPFGGLGLGQPLAGQNTVGAQLGGDGAHIAEKGGLAVLAELGFKQGEKQQGHRHQNGPGQGGGEKGQAKTELFQGPFLFAAPHDGSSRR